MIKYYSTALIHNEPEIIKVNIEKETKCFVWINGRRLSKDHFHDSIDDTIIEMLNIAQSNINLGNEFIETGNKILKYIDKVKSQPDNWNA